MPLILLSRHTHWYSQMQDVESRVCYSLHKMEEWENSGFATKCTWSNSCYNSFPHHIPRKEHLCHVFFSLQHLSYEMFWRTRLVLLFKEINKEGGEVFENSPVRLWTVTYLLKLITSLNLSLLTSAVRTVAVRLVGLRCEAPNKHLAEPRAQCKSLVNSGCHSIAGVVTMCQGPWQPLYPSPTTQASLPMTGTSSSRMVSTTSAMMWLQNYTNRPIWLGHFSHLRFPLPRWT